MTNPAVFLGSQRSYTAVPSAAYTAAPAAVDIDPPVDTTGVVVTLDLTAFVTAASLTFTVYGVDDTSGKQWQIATLGGPVISAVSTVTLRIHPNNTTPVATGTLQVAQGQLPPRIRVQVTQGNANSTTYSVGVDFTN